MASPSPNDPVMMDCPACKADDFEVCDHTEDERVVLRAERARKNREKKKRNKANARAEARHAFFTDRWV